MTGGAAERGLRRGLILGGALVLAAAIGFGARWLVGAGRQDERLGTPSIGGPFALIDQDGRPVNSVDFRGKLMLIYFGFTWCPDICPTELQSMALALDALGPQAALAQAIFISVDPERDKPEVLKAYVAQFHERLIGLTGSAEQTAAAAKAYKVYYAKSGNTGGADYQIDHSGFIYLMDRTGIYLTHFRPGTPPAEIATRIRQLR